MRVTDALIMKNLHNQPIVNGGLDVMKCDKVQRMQEFSLSDLNKCKDEKLKLQAVVADLKQVNRRWQTYNNDMQIFIKRLQSTIQDQQEQLNNMADYQVERLLQTPKEHDTTCRRCEPVIEYLRKRIRCFEDKLSKLESHQSYSAHLDQSSELLSLQLRLRQAYQHIHHLNRIMWNSGILKTGYNLLPEPPHSVRPCSLDGLKFFECDNKSVETDSKTSKEMDSGSNITIIRPDSPSTSWEDARDEIEHIPMMEKSLKDDNSKTLPTPTPLNISNNCLKDSYNFCSSEKSNLEGSLIDSREGSCDIYNLESIENTREVDYSVKIPPDRLNMNLSEGSQSTSSSDKFYLSLLDSTSRFNKDFETNYNPPQLDSSYGFLSSSIDSTNSSQYGSTSKLDSPSSSDYIYGTSPLRKTSNYWDEDYIGKKEFHGTHSPITCPHCHTVFPPDTMDGLSQHLISCQYL